MTTWQAYYARKHERGAARALTMYLLWQQGHTFAAIGRGYGLTGDMVAKTLAKHGYVRRRGIEPVETLGN